jgi:hypothetical protein
VTTGILLGTAGGFYAGCLLLRPTLHWPPREDYDRLLLLVFPAVLLVELGAAHIQRPRTLFWLMRGLVALALPRVLLHGSVFLQTDSTAAESKPGKVTLILAGIGLALAAAWFLLSRLAPSVGGRFLALVLVATAIATAVAVALSGYLAAGLLGFAMAASLAGIVVGSLLLKQVPDMRVLIGPAVVCIASLLIVGYFFGELSLANALFLAAAPLLCSIPELIPVVRPWKRSRALVSVGLVGVCLCVAVVNSIPAFTKPPQTNEESADQATTDDYANYGR